MRVETKELTYTYSESSKALSVKALDGVTLTIEEGEFFGIIGQTGSGKTTFVQHLNGLIKVGKDKGSVKIGEFDLTAKKCDFKTLRAKVGMVFQYPEYQLFAETVFEDVAFGLKNFAHDIDDKEKEVRVREAIELVGLNYNKIKDKSPFELSGGQKRRVAIAGVIVTRPEVLVLDEPAAGLDPVGKREFLSLLHKLHGAFVKTIILVSHDMNLVSENCTRAAIFSHGKLHSVGTPKEIFARYGELESLGLDLPVTAALTRALNGVGVSIDSDLTVDDFVKKVATEFGGDR
ncbi:MAG: energy-coupling factor transporter ATPase [Clostridia bacterium]|nr:energy-coupling factor transporter ATPase [Clostridia bacterium]